MPTDRYVFTIDWVGLCNTQKIPIDHIAHRAGLPRDRVRGVVTRDPVLYGRITVGHMLHALDVRTYPPMLLEHRRLRGHEGPCLSVDWPTLLDTTGANIPWLVAKTRLRRHVIYHMIKGQPVQYARLTLGTVLYVLGVNLYPPFFLVNEASGEPRGPYEPIKHDDYYRSRKH